MLFRSVINDLKIPINERDVRSIFNSFDNNGIGIIDYEEFLNAIKGNMNSFRQGLVELAFNNIDKDGKGAIEVYNLKNLYCAKNHPDVKSEIKTEDQALGDFLETFELFKSIYGSKNDRIVTKEEFLEYYNNISASIDSDKEFETLLYNVWRLKGEEPKEFSWGGKYTRPLTASQYAPFGTSEEPTDYSTSLRPITKYNKEERKNLHAAGCPTWTKNSVECNIQRTSNKQMLIGFRKIISTRGIRGIVNLYISFKYIDKKTINAISST